MCGNGDEIVFECPEDGCSYMFRLHNAKPRDLIRCPECGVKIALSDYRVGL